MKGLLLKEFYVWKKTRSWLTVYAVAFALLGSFLSSRLVSTPMFLFSMSFFLSFQNDEKSGWEKYQKTLPVTPLQSVSAKYITTIAESIPFIFACVFSTLFSKGSFFDIVSTTTAEELASDVIFAVSILLIFMAIELPVCFGCKGAVGTVIVIILATVFLLMSATLGIIFNITFEDPVTLILLIVISLLILGISFTLSVNIVSGQDSAYKKKFKRIAIILTVIAVALGGVILGISMKNKAENKKQPDSADSGYDMIRNYDEIKNDFDNLYSGFCNEFHLNTTVEECAQALEGIGYFQNKTNPEKFYSESGKINLFLTVDEETDKVISTYAYSNLTVEKEFDSATPQDFAQIESNFYDGISQNELHERMRKLEVFPSSVSETLIYDNQPRRVYVMNFSCDNYDGKPDNRVLFKITVVTDGDVVVEVERHLFNQNKNSGSLSGSIDEESTETVLEKGKREATEFIKAFCNENHLDGTPRECIKKLRSLGFSESEEKFDLYYSKDGKVSVSLVTDEDDKLREISAVINYGEMHYLESATEEEMADLAANFTEGMTENQFQQKLIELELSPDSIVEKFSENNSHLRVYEIKYRIGDYDGNGAATWSLTVDVTDGKVTDVLAF